MDFRTGSLFYFDFSTDAVLFGRATVPLVSYGGRVNAILRWTRIDLIPGVTYENAPSPHEKSHWALVAMPLPEVRETARGEVIEIGGWHDATTVLLWANT
jgi:hypothetical protein